MPGIALSRRIVSYLPLPRGFRRRWLARLSKAWYRAELEKARQTNNKDRTKELQWEQREDAQEEFEWGEIEYSNKFERTARQVRVPIPPYGDAGSDLTPGWIQSRFFGEPYLSQQGIAEIREAIRREQTWRQQRRAHLITWVTALTGLVGALTGLLAIVLRTK